MKFTELEGFPVQYSPDVVRHLNLVYSTYLCNNATFHKIAKVISPDVKNIIFGNSTADGYDWYDCMVVPVGDARIAILFPWARDKSNPISEQDRSINVYSDKPLPKEDVKGLLEQVAYQMTLKFQESGTQ
ncbi:MAG: hypothetical protein V1743_00375 [Nanoarchaeota archaeon]